MSFRYNVCLLAEKYSEFSKSLYLCYLDYQKAFDSVWREGLWHVMEHLGYEGKIIHLLKALYMETFSDARVDGEISEWFQTVGRVLQGCVLSPLLFCIYLEVVTARALITEDISGYSLHYPDPVFQYPWVPGYRPIKEKKR